MDTSELLAEIHKHINRATRIADLYEVLKYTTLQDLKKFAHQQMNALNTDRIRPVHRRVLPINNVVPDALIQQCLSFSGYPAKFVNRRVCTLWNALYKSNQANSLRGMFRSVNEKFPDPLPPGNSTWIMHSTRLTLHPVEERLGYKGPLSGNTAAVNSCKSGDRVLVHKTVRGDLTALGVDKVDKDIHIIGHLSRQCEFHWDNVRLLGHITMDNVTVHASHLRIGSNDDRDPIGGKQKLTFRNCIILCSFKWITVEPGGTLEMINCTMMPYEEHCVEDNGLAIGISPWAKRVEIHNNKFSGFTRGIAIQRNNEIDGYGHELAEINITDNLFENCQYLVIERLRLWSSQEARIAGKDKCTLQGNKCESGTSDGNKLQVVLEDFEPN